jgi:hypothetical protein
MLNRNICYSYGTRQNHMHRRHPIGRKRPRCLTENDHNNWRHRAESYGPRATLPELIVG